MAAGAPAAGPAVVPGAGVLWQADLGFGGPFRPEPLSPVLADVLGYDEGNDGYLYHFASQVDGRITRITRRNADTKDGDEEDRLTPDTPPLEALKVFTGFLWMHGFVVGGKMDGMNGRGDLNANTRRLLALKFNQLLGKLETHNILPDPHLPSPPPTPAQTPALSPSPRSTSPDPPDPELARLKQLFEDAQKALEAANEATKEADDRRKNAEAQLEEIKQENEQLKLDLQKAATDREAANKERDEALQRTASLETARAQVQADLETERKAKADMQREMTVHFGQCVFTRNHSNAIVLQEQLESATARFAVIEAKVAEANVAASDNAQTQVGRATTEHQQAVGRLQQQISTLKGQLQLGELERSHLKAQSDRANENLVIAINVLNGGQIALSKANDALIWMENERNKAQERAAITLERLGRVTSELEATRRQLSDAHDAAHDRREDLEGALTNMKAHFRE